MSRVIGSDGYDRTANYLRDQIKAIGSGRADIELKEQSFELIVPHTINATLTTAVDGKAVRIYPFWPAQIRACTTPKEGIRGQLVYIRTAHVEEIPPARIKGQIAVIESAAQDRWRQAAYFGASAIIVLGSADTTNFDLRSQELSVPINVPRFYLPAGKLADDIRAGRVNGDVVLDCDVQWQRKTATNLYVLVKPSMQIAGWKDKNPPGAIVISAPYESSGLVPDLAQGAGQAVNTAVALEMLRDAASHPLNRPVLFFFGGGDSIQFRATREMLMTFSDVPNVWAKELDDPDVGMHVLLPIAQAQRKRLGEVVDEPWRLDAAADRDLLDRVTRIIEADTATIQDQLLRIRTGRTTIAAVDRETKRIERESRQAALSQLRFLLQKKPASLKDPNPDNVNFVELARAYIQQAITRMDGGETPVGNLRGLLNDYEFRRRQLQTRIDLYHWLAGELGLPTDPDGRNNSPRLIELMIAIDLSDHGSRVGPLTYGEFQRTANGGQDQDYKEWFSRLVDGAKNKKPQAAWFNDQSPWLDLIDPLANAKSPATWLCASMPIGTEMCMAWGVPGFSMVTLDDSRLTRDTPLDVLGDPISSEHGKFAGFSGIDIGALRPQMTALWQLLRNAIDDPAFHRADEARWQHNSFRGQVVSVSPNRPVPDLPRPGFLVTAFYASTTTDILKPRMIPYAMGIRRDEVAECDAEGNYIYEGLPKLHGDLQVFGVEAFRIRPGDRGRVSATTDIGRQSSNIHFYAEIKSDVTPLANVVFDCNEFSLTGLYDPRFLQDLSDVIMLDARRNDAPQRYNLIIGQQLAAGYVEPGNKQILLFRYGRVGNRLILLNMPPVTQSGEAPASDLGEGFSAEQLTTLGPLSLATANDFFQLDSYRLEKYRKAGFSNSLIDFLHANARAALLKARGAERGQLPPDSPAPAGRDHQTVSPQFTGADVMREANYAWANEARVYSAATDLADDVVHAAIFLLLLCVPFSFCMERLLIGSASIYKQLTYTFLFFLLMTGVLWSFHPAFKISSSPLIIILAFAIIFMSLVVIGVVYGKFDSELKKIRSGRGTAQATSFASTSVLMSAVLLGIANMRKRKFRTLLTSITIVLITFAVLCFTSSSTFLDTTTLSTGVMPRVPALMMRQRGYRPMPLAVLENLRAVLPKRTLAERWWNVNASDAKEYINIVAVPAAATPTLAVDVDRATVAADATGPAMPAPAAPATQPAAPAAPPVKAPATKPLIFAATAVLGLSPGEGQLTSIADIIGRDKFRRLDEGGETHIIYLSSDIATALKVKEGDNVRVGGIDLAVAGIFDAARFDAEAQDLDGEQLTPLDYGKTSLDTQGRKLDDTAADSFDLDSGASASELGSSYDHLPANKIVIVPAAISRMLPNASLRNVAIHLDDYRQVKPISDDLAKRFAVAIFAGYEDGVRMVSANNSLPKVSGAAVAIPLAIAGLIIFNTMMGSISERRREIHVYTSLGLAPVHVGALFVAEALTYGLIGTVFGYVIGQGVGTLMNHFHLLGQVSLNYSGTSAMLTMGLILLIVLLSALVPARLASKIAAPSIERSWRVPLPKDGEILAHLPFTINKTAADGALAYIADFFDAHQEGSIGKFSSGPVEAFIFQDEAQRASRGLKTVIWLTPFDLGVRQHLMLLIHPGQFEDIYEVQVVLQRLSGDDGSWYRMNRSFLTELRKQFLQWRSLSPQRMMQFVEQSKKLFAGTNIDQEAAIATGK